ncbi:MAG: AarF/ABC1/UbiB kinase family protein [Nodosilinea sp.]
MALDTTQTSAQRFGSSVDIIDAEATAVAEDVIARPLPTPTPPRTLANKPQDPFEESGYDPAAIASHYRRRPLKVWARFVGIFLPVISFFVQLWLDRRAGRSAQNEAVRAVQLREILTRLGPAYIKIGQALSTRPDLVPPIFLEELTTLQDQIPPFPNEIAYRFIEEELGAPPNQIYAELSQDPIAAASLGQVYKGKLHSGEDVAIKVQRPGLAQRIALDLYIIRGLARFATNRVSQIRSDLVAILDEFGERIFEEMDYTHEGENAQRFADLYSHIPDIYVPHIYPQYTARRVLTMEWIEGTKLTNIDKLDRLGIDASHLIEVGVQCSLRQLLEHGFFHADPHPGNLLAMADGKLAYLDFGMMSEVKPYQRYGLIEAVVHMVNRDFDGLAHDYVKLEFLTPDTDLTPIIPALANVFSNALGASVAELNFKSITDEFSALMYEYPFRVPAYYALIIRSLVTLEGIAINVDPEFKVLSKAYPYVAKRLLTDSSPELRASLQDLLFKDGSFRWNRLENLLRNASASDEYDMDRLVDQTLEFLFSDRGTFLRDRIVSELVNSLDSFGQSTVRNLTNAIQRRLGLKKTPAVAAAPPSDLDHLRRILDILKDTPGFDATQVAARIPTLLFKPETQAMGQQVVSGLAQRALARLIRTLLLEDEVASTKPQLPPAAAIRYRDRVLG